MNNPEICGEAWPNPMCRLVLTASHFFTEAPSRHLEGANSAPYKDPWVKERCFGHPGEPGAGRNQQTEETARQRCAHQLTKGKRESRRKDFVRAFWPILVRVQDLRLCTGQEAEVSSSRCSVPPRGGRKGGDGGEGWGSPGHLMIPGLNWEGLPLRYCPEESSRQPQAAASLVTSER